jgi:hypothetical protein
MPALSTQLSGPTTTFYVPLAMRIDWTDGINSYQDLWWIPHGIRWPENTLSTLGAVIVSGLEVYPSVFVDDELQLMQAVTDLTPTGGVICVESNITIDTAITIPDGVTLLSRSETAQNTNPAILTFVPGGSLIMGNNSRLFDLYLVGSSTFGVSSNASMVQAANDKCEIRNCMFNFGNASGLARGVLVTGTNNRIYNCKFLNCSADSWRTGIEYNAGSNNVDIDSEFT